MARKVKINRMTRKVLHETFPLLVLGPLRLVSSQLDWMTRAHKDGFTPGERELLQKRRELLIALTEDMQKIYFRLKH